MDITGYIVTFLIGLVAGSFLRRGHKLSLRVLKGTYQAGVQDGMRQTLIYLSHKPDVPTEDPPKLN